MRTSTVQTLAVATALIVPTSIALAFGESDRQAACEDFADNAGLAVVSSSHGAHANVPVRRVSFDKENNRCVIQVPSIGR
jgi:hypothetical protein